jgi:hypothetical protein
MQEEIENKAKPRKDDRIEIAQHILRYLRANPEAKDTLEGIAEWWLLQSKIEEAVKRVSEAVEWLVANGYLLENRVTGSKTIYEINPTKRDEAMKFLETEE